VGKFARDKGARGEREFAAIMNKNGHECRRGSVFLNEPDIVGLKGIHAEVKTVEKLNLRRALQQSITDADKRQDGMPIVAWKKKHDPNDREAYAGWTVTMLLSDFIEIYGAWADE